MTGFHFIMIIFIIIILTIIICKNISIFDDEYLPVFFSISIIVFSILTFVLYIQESKITSAYRIQESSRKNVDPFEELKIIVKNDCIQSGYSDNVYYLDSVSPEDLKNKSVQVKFNDNFTESGSFEAYLNEYYIFEDDDFNIINNLKYYVNKSNLWDVFCESWGLRKKVKQDFLPGP